MNILLMAAGFILFAYGFSNAIYYFWSTLKFIWNRKRGVGWEEFFKQEKEHWLLLAKMFLSWGIAFAGFILMCLSYVNN